MQMRTLLLLTSLCLSGPSAWALDISVVGIFPGKAVLIVDGAAPKTYSAGNQINNDAKLISTDSSSATFLIYGKRETIAMGQHVARSSSSGIPTVTLHADSLGHFTTTGRINGSSIKLLVDTGASMISLSAADASRIGIPYKQGKRGMVSTANGVVPVYKVKLDSVKVGDIELHHVEANILETSLSHALLGMSFLNRTDMLREGGRLTLTKRY